MCTITADDLNPLPSISTTENFTITFNSGISSSSQPWYLYLNSSTAPVTNSQIVNSTDFPGGISPYGDTSLISKTNVTEDVLAGNTYHISASWDASNQNNGDTWYPQFSNNNNDGCTVDTPISFTFPSPPAVNPVPSQIINEGDTYTASGTINDPSATSLTATVDYGDGSGPHSLSLSGDNFSLSYRYPGMKVNILLQYQQRTITTTR